MSQLGPKQLSQLEDLTRETISGLIDEFPSDGVVDFASAFCEKLTARFFGTLLGMTDEEKVSIVDSIRDMIAAFRRAYSCRPVCLRSSNSARSFREKRNRQSPHRALGRRP